MSEFDSIQRLTGEVGAALLPLEWILGNPLALRDFLSGALGYDVPAALTSLGVDPATVSGVLDAFDELGGLLGEESPDTGRLATAWAVLVASVAEVTAAVYAGPASLTGQLDPAFLTASHLIETLPRRLMDWLVVERMQRAWPVLHRLLVVLGVIETVDVEADPATFTTRHQRRVVRYDRIPRLLSDPGDLFVEVYGWGTPGARLNELLGRLASLHTVMGGRAEFRLPSAELKQQLYDPASAQVRFDYAHPPQLRVPLARSGPAEVGLSLVVLPPLPAGGAPGLALVPFAGAGEAIGIPVDANGAWMLSVRGSLDATAGLGVVARPGHPLHGVLRGGGAASGRLVLELRRSEPADEPIVVATFGGGAGLTAADLWLGAGVVLQTAGDEIFVEVGMAGGKLRSDLAGADGFVGRLFPNGLAAPLDLTLGLSSKRGVYFQGGAGLEVTEPLHLTVGPVSLNAITVKLASGDGTVELSFAASAAVRLGPVTATVSGVGATIRATAPDHGGNVGPVQLDVRFRPPDGVGLSIDAGPVTGGGFLFFDAVQQRYAGAVHLDFEGIALNAVGLLTTRLPDGADGWSLVLLVSSSGFAPVPLGYGFRLTGVGGLFGVDRTVDVDTLRAGLRDHTLDSVLMIRDDPVPRAAQIVSVLQKVFPPAAGRYLFGPMAVIEWGTPTVLTVDLALLLEVPAPLRLVVLGRVRALLPPVDERTALVKLRMDAVGVIEFDQCRASLDASLYDSSIAGCAVSGDLALRMSWGEQPGFALAIGGFHPRFTPPPGFPQLRRVSVPLSTGDNPRLRLEAYLALTSNTVQVGARLELRVAAAGFVLDGVLAFDALVQVDPFRLDLDIVGGLALMRGSHVLMAVEVRLHLTGPAPWHAVGYATFRVLFFKVHVSFDATFGQPRPVRAAQPAAIWPLLRAALVDAGSWTVGQPAGAAASATLQAQPVAGAAEILAHPLGRVAVRQRVVPLQRDISRFADAAPADFHWFAIDTVTIGTATYTPTVLVEPFAPAQFVQMSPEEQLSAPGYEQMPAGAQVADASPVAGPARPVTIEFETVVLGVATPAQAYVPTADTVARLAETGAAAARRAWPAGRSRYRVEAAAPVRLRPAQYVVRTRDTLTVPAGVAPTDGSYSDARQALDRLARLDPALARNAQIIRREEVPA